MKKTVWLLLAGEFALPPYPVAAGDTVIAVDGGIYHAAALQLTPQLWLGDFDSSDCEALPQYAAIPRQSFPQDKDETDFELALRFIRQTYPETEQLLIIGGLGGEKDHEFANLWLMPAFGFRAVFFGQKETRLFARGPVCWHLHGQPGANISVFALTALSGLTYRGLQWPLENAALAPFAVRACRNRLCATSGEIRWQEGYGAVFLAAGIYPALADTKAAV